METPVKINDMNYWRRGSRGDDNRKSLPAADAISKKRQSAEKASKFRSFSLNNFSIPSFPATCRKYATSDSYSSRLGRFCTPFTS